MKQFNIQPRNVLFTRNTPCKGRVLAVSMALSCFAMTSHALEAMSEKTMSSVTGKDGIHITTELDSASIEQVAWEDETGKTLQFNGVSAQGAASSPLRTEIKLNTGSNASGQAGIGAELVMSAMTISVDEAAINNTDATGVTTKNILGKLAFKTSKDTLLKLNTSAGVFNEQGSVDLEVKLDGADIFLTDEQNSGAKLNQLILSDTRLHAKVDGKLYVSNSDGLVLDANKIILVADGSRAGLQAALMLKGDITEGGNVASAAQAQNFSRDGAKGLLRVGVSGQLNATKIKIRGTDAANSTNLQDSTLSVLGNKGIAISIDGEYENTGENPLSFDIGEAGNGGYGVRFSQLKAFNPQENKAMFSLGNTYINILNVSELSLPETTLNQSSGSQINGLYVAKQLASSADFTYSVPNQDSLAIMTRGLSLQGVPQKAKFIQNGADATDTETTNDWSLAPLVYNLNANMTITDGGSKTLETARSKDDPSVNAEQFDNVLNISLGLTTQGVNSTDTNPDSSVDNSGLKTTSILLVDPTTSSSKPLQTYVGLRNIDTLLTAQGDLGISQDSLIMNFSNFNLAFSAELAAGALPTNNAGNIENRFNNRNDTLMGLRGRINAEYLNLELKSGENTEAGNFVGYEADFKLKSDGSSFVHIVDTVDSTTIGLDELKGRLRVLNGRVDVTPDESVRFSNTFVVNPLHKDNEVLEVGSVNFYPSTGTGLSAPQRLGEAVITGGKLDVDLTLKPVNTVPSFP